MQNTKFNRNLTLESKLKKDLRLLEISEIEVYSVRPHIHDSDCILINFLVDHNWYHVDMGLDLKSTEDENYKRVQDILLSCLKQIRLKESESMNRRR